MRYKQTGSKMSTVLKVFNVRTNKAENDILDIFWVGGEKVHKRVFDIIGKLETRINVWIFREPKMDGLVRPIL